MEHTEPQKIITKRGRPPTYNPEKHPYEAYELMSKGTTDCELATDWGISRETLYEWKRTHEEFKEQHELGKDARLAYYIRKVRECWENGDDAGYKYFKVLAKTQLGLDIDSTQAPTTNTYNINNMQIVNTKEDYLQLVQDVRQQAKELNLLDIMPEDIIDVDQSSQD